MKESDSIAVTEVAAEEPVTIPRVAVVIYKSDEPGQEPKIIVAGGPVETMIIDMSKLDLMLPEAATAYNLNDLLTWVRQSPDMKAMGKLHDDVVLYFKQQGLDI